MSSISISSFSLGISEECCQYQRTDSDTGKYRSVRRHIVMFNTNKNNNVSFEGLLIIMSVSTFKAAVILNIYIYIL